MKILHTLAACGLIGGLGCYMIMLVAAPQAQSTPAAYADLRQSISVISNYVLLPSLALALVSGLLSMAVHQPFLDKGWVWIKALLGILMFKGVLTIVSAKADYAATVALRIANGEAPADALGALLVLEWWTLVAVMAISIANIVLGVWRPRFMRQSPTVMMRSTEADRASGGAKLKPSGVDIDRAA
ncbi:MAG: DUF2269 family protein [Pseudomonadota bacterium]